MNLVQSLRYSILSPVIAMSVVLSGAHAKDVAGLSAVALMPRKKIDDSSQQVKIHAEVHPHVEKAKIVAGGDQTVQLDNRSLRLLNEQKKDITKLGLGLGRLLRDWWQAHAPMLFASLL